MTLTITEQLYNAVVKTLASEQKQRSTAQKPLLTFRQIRDTLTQLAQNQSVTEPWQVAMQNSIETVNSLSPLSQPDELSKLAQFFRDLAYAHAAQAMSRKSPLDRAWTI